MIIPSILIVPGKYNNNKLISQIPVNESADFTVSRLTTATRVNSNGLINLVTNNVPRIDYLNQSCPALLVEASGQNQIRNNSMVGAVAGSPGTMPTNWAEALNGLVRQSVALGTENGVSYIDIRYSGTATGGSCAVLFETATQIVASTGQTWSNSVYLKIIAQPNPPIAYRLSMWEYNTGGTVFSGSFATNVVPTTTSLQRFTQTRALTGATTDRVRPLFDVLMTSGQTYDFTIRIGYPQMEQSSFATSVIPTTSGIGSRDADVISASSISGLIGQTEGTIYVEGIITNYADAAASFITVSDNSITNRLEIRKASPNLIILERNSTTQSGSTSISLSGQGSGTFKMAVSYISGNTVFFVNGVQVGATNTDTFTMNTLTHVYLGSNATGSARRLNDRIRAAAIYTTRLSNNELQLLTKL